MLEAATTSMRRLRSWESAKIMTSCLIASSNLWIENGETYKKIKALFEELKSMENLPSCDRYEKLQILASLDAGYLKKMETYDNYVIGSDAAQDTTEAEATKKIGSARSYLSKNIDKLAELKSASEAVTATDADKEAYAALLDKLQQTASIFSSAHQLQLLMS